MKSQKVYWWSFAASLGGFLFGFDTAVISGAEKAIQQVWLLTAWEHGFTVSIALIGTVAGAISGGWPADRWGRRPTLLIIAILYLVSALGSALVNNWYLFLFFRFIGGLGVGASSVVAPMFISEISPAKVRGQLVALFQLNIVFGILIAYVSNYLLSDFGSTPWRWMLGVEAIPALIFLLLVLQLPESPRWLIIRKNNAAQAEKILQKIQPASVSQVVKEIQATASHAGQERVNMLILFTDYQTSAFLAIAFAVFNQLTGINAIIYYAPRIFEMTGLGASTALLTTSGIGIVMFIFTGIALKLIDHHGRRKLMLAGSYGLILTLGLIARAFYLEQFSGYLVPVLVFIYIAFFSFSQGAVIWVFIAEIFPNRARAAGQSLGSFTHWFMAAVVAFIFPVVADKIGGGNTFLIFTIMMIFQLLFVLKIMPETKGKSLEEIEFRKITS